MIWHPRPEANLKYRLIDETESFPGLSIGLDTQGQGKFHSADSLMRYDVKAMGMYISTSKNWITPLGNLGFHLGSNYNFTEINDGDDDINYFFGFDFLCTKNLLSPSVLPEIIPGLFPSKLTACNIGKSLDTISCCILLCAS